MAVTSKNSGFDVPIIGADPELMARLRGEAENRAKERLRRKKVSVRSFESNVRKQARYPFTNAVTCIPVLESRELASTNVMMGIGIDIGTGGVKVLVDGAKPFPGMELVTGLEIRPREYLFCGGTVMDSKRIGSSNEVSLAFRGYMHEVFQNEQILPVLDRDDLRYVFPYPEAMLASLCKVGAAVSLKLDDMLLCPSCSGIPTFRNGCSLCLSSNVRTSRMIHHFACAHVDFVEAFEEDNELCCPKCRIRRMIVGSDYEYLDGPNMCADCGQANLEKIRIGHCLSCENRFPAETCLEFNVVGYRVNRLDVLAFINSN